MKRDTDLHDPIRVHQRIVFRRRTKMSKKILKIRHLLLLGAFLFLAVGCTTVSTSGDYTLPSGQTLQGNSDHHFWRR